MSVRPWAWRPTMRLLSNRTPARRPTVRLRLASLEDRCVPATFRWINPTDGDFALAANWEDQSGSPGVPTAADDALILTPGVTVTSAGTNAVRNLTSVATLDVTGGTLTAAAANFVGSVDVSGGNLILGGPSTAATVTLSGGTIAGAGTLDLSGGMTWTGGTVGLNLHVPAAATLDIAGAASKTLNNVTLTNDGTVTWAGSGGLNLQLAAAVQNNGLIRDQADHVATTSGTGVLRNPGQYVREAGAGTSEIAIPLDNTGSVRAESGTLRLSGGAAQFDIFGILTAGTWYVGGGATLDTAGWSLSDNAAHITLGGPGAAFTALDLFSTNDGDFALAGGAAFADVNGLGNFGQITIGPGSTFDVDNFYLAPQGQLVVQVGATAGRLTDTTGTTFDGGTVEIAVVPAAAAQTNDVYTLLNSFGISGSPAQIVQSGAGSTAPFTVAVGATRVTATANLNITNLAVTAVTPPATPAAPGDDMTVTWAVKNNAGVATSATDWTDAVYLSASATYDDAAVLVGTVAHSGSLGAGAAYGGSFTGPVPGLVPGTYHVFVVADADRTAPDADRVDNVGAAGPTFTVTDLAGPQVLPLDTPAIGTVAAGQDLWYRVDAPGGTPLRVTATFGAAGAGELSVDYRRYPQPGSALGSAADPSSAVEQVVLTATQAGTYYLRVHGTAGGGFTLQADTPSFGITRLVNATGSRAGIATLTVHGMGFTPNATVSLAQGAVNRTAVSVLYVGPDTVYASFNLTGLAPGGYDVTITDGTRTDTVLGGYTVNAAAVGTLVYHITPPALTPIGREVLATIQFTNTGGTDLPAPLLLLSDESFEFHLRLSEEPPPGPFDESESIYFLPTSTDAPAGIIPPGYQGTIDVLVTRSFGTDPLNLLLERVNPGKPIPWNSFKGQLRPTDVPTDAWGAVFGNFKATVGGTSDTYFAALRNAATYLAAVGTPVRDASALLGYLMGQADAVPPGSTLYQVTDVAFPSPGLSLDFTRGFLQSVSGHYRLGRLGRGWVDNWDITLGNEFGGPPRSDFGDNILHIGGTNREFAPVDDSPHTTYRPIGGGEDVLAFDGNRFVLTGHDGTVVAFRPDGQLDYFQYRDGTRVTAGYDAKSRLTSLTHSNGRAMAFTWNSGGRIASVTDPAGRVTKFAYSGQHLVSATSPRGTEKYTYAGLPASRKHALASVTTPDKVKTTFKYDTRGRLTSQQRAGTGAVTYAYGVGGGVTTTDAAGERLTVLADADGRLAAIRSGTGSVLRVAFDADGLPVRTETSTGQVWTTARDADGRATAVTNPLGRTVRYAYDDESEIPATVTDARGNTTGYQTDPAGHTLAITYPGAGGTESFVYDPTGEQVETVTRRGNAVVRLTNADGQVVRRVFADGSAAEYAYGPRGNLTAATDPSGTTTFEYQFDDRLRKVTYPDGRFLQLAYDTAGRRASSVDQDGFTTNYVYDAAGRLAQLVDGTGARLVKYAYDDAGRVTRKDDGNGTFATYSYDPAGRLQTLVNHAPGGAVNSQFDYTYDDTGRIATETADGVTTTYGYDLTGELTSVVRPGRTLAYTYDAAGNRTSVTDNGVTTTYTVNELNQVTAAGATTYTYDADGNRLTTTDASGTTTYTWNDLDQLTGASSPTDTFAYTYDPLGRLWQATQNGQTTTNLTDPLGMGSVAAQYGPGGLAAHYVNGLGLEARVDADGTRAFYDFDQIGNVVGLTGTSGAYVNRYDYLPFGETMPVLSGIADNPFTFAGRWGVSADGSGLFNMRARSYDPAAGGFVSDDPLGLAGGDLNIRRYASNDPVNFLDPTGLKEWCWYGPFGVDPYVEGGPDEFFGLTIGASRGAFGGFSLGQSAGWGIGLGFGIGATAGVGPGVILGPSVSAGLNGGVASAGLADAGAGIHAGAGASVNADLAAINAGYSNGFSNGISLGGSRGSTWGFIFGWGPCPEDPKKDPKKTKPPPDLKHSSPRQAKVPGTTPVQLL
jgi:RHS repeat-associated protein